MPDDRMEAALDYLVGDREEFRKLLLDAGGILSRMCRCAASEARRSRVGPWCVVSTWTGHGSGVSKAIYYLYGGPDAK